MSEITVTDQSFEEDVLNADIPVLTDFWAEWCGPCKAIAPIVAEIAQEHEGELKVVKLDVDSNPQTAMTYGVMSIPTLILYKDRQPVARIVGYQNKAQLLQKISPHLNTKA